MMEAYKEWVRHNRQWISSIESLASTATWFLPDRFANYELASEAVSTLLGLVTVMNQHIVETAPPAPPRYRRDGPQQPVPAPQRDQDQGFPYGLGVSVMKEIEVLTEMAAETFLGKDQKWAPVASVEAIKAVLRLIILKKSGYKLLLDGGETKNTEDASQGSEQNSPEDSRRPSPHEREHQGSGPSRPDIDPALYPRDLEGRAMQAMQKFGAHNFGPNRPSWARQRLDPPIQEVRAVEQRTYIPRPIRAELKLEPPYKCSSFVAGEVLLISRPLVYVLLVWRYGLKSWRPWLSSLSVDLIGMYLVSSATTEADRRLASERPPSVAQASLGSLSARERQELRRRQLLWALYVMRNPFFDSYTRRPLEKVESLLSPVPLFGTLAGKAVELLYAVQGFYSYTAAS
ncbi:hypothetical protein R1sor_023940 [Riccia sorocarpa]|uniref:Peroxisomal membrane protein PEX16 n=1 Tax=Riccia sorocarpa TaxID=122646 RepID=A0ABD3GRE4_9MARC